MLIPERIGFDGYDASTLQRLIGEESVLPEARAYIHKQTNVMQNPRQVINLYALLHVRPKILLFQHLIERLGFHYRTSKDCNSGQQNKDHQDAFYRRHESRPR